MAGDANFGRPGLARGLPLSGANRAATGTASEHASHDHYREDLGQRPTGAGYAHNHPTRAAMLRQLPGEISQWITGPKRARLNPTAQQVARAARARRV